MAIAPSPWRPERQALLVEVGAAVTPTMTWHHHVLLLDVKASLNWLGGVRGLKRRLQQELLALGVAARLAIALTATGAWLLAMDRGSSPHSLTWRYGLTPRRLHQRLDIVAIECLPEAKRHFQWLHRVGCYQLGQLRLLDRAELSTRTDLALLNALDQAYGQAVFRYQPLTLPLQFEQQLELPRFIEHTNALEPYIKRLLQSLCDWLVDHHLALTRLECRLYHRDRRRAWQPTILMLAVRNPTSAHAVLWRWLQVRLERCILPAPVSDLAIITRTLSPRLERNLSLFADEHLANDNESAVQTLDLLRARLGQTRVQQACPVADYRLEVANAWGDSENLHPNPVALDWGAHCPAWLLSEPRPLSVRQDKPCLQGPLRLLQGPYRIETGWWDQNLALRDYFVAADRSQRRYWVYRERDQLHARWFLHGLFG